MFYNNLTIVSYLILNPTYIYKVKLATIVEGDSKAPFSLATTPRCRRVLLLFLDCSTLPLIRTLYCWELRKKVSSAIFKSLVWPTWDWTHVLRAIGEYYNHYGQCIYPMYIQKRINTGGTFTKTEMNNERSVNFL